VPHTTDPDGKTTAPGGKLYHKFNNAKRKLNKHGLYPSVYRPSKKHKPVEELSFVEPDQNEVQAMENLRDWLRLNHPTFEILEQKWRDSAKYRKIDLKNAESISSILENWPKYKTATGSYLVK
jgi:hypothetical protein